MSGLYEKWAVEMRAAGWKVTPPAGGRGPCPLCSGFVNALHEPGCGYFGDGAEAARDQDAQRLAELAARFDRDGAHPALSVAAAMARVVQCHRTISADSDSPEESAALAALAAAYARLSAVMPRLYNG